MTDENQNQESKQAEQKRPENGEIIKTKDWASGPRLYLFFLWWAFWGAYFGMQGEKLPQIISPPPVGNQETAKKDKRWKKFKEKLKRIIFRTLRTILWVIVVIMCFVALPAGIIIAFIPVFIGGTVLYRNYTITTEERVMIVTAGFPRDTRTLVYSNTQTDGMDPSTMTLFNRIGTLRITPLETQDYEQITLPLPMKIGEKLENMFGRRASLEHKRNI